MSNIQSKAKSRLNLTLVALMMPLQASSGKLNLVAETNPNQSEVMSIDEITGTMSSFKGVDTTF